MARPPRLDAPATLHHVMERGIERTAIFRDDRDRSDFVARLVEQGSVTVYACTGLRGWWLWQVALKMGRLLDLDSLRLLSRGPVMRFEIPQGMIVSPLPYSSGVIQVS